MFAQPLHELFLQAMATGNIAAFQVPNFDVNLSRFSINCIGFFGDFVSGLAAVEFCPAEVDDEEWISAVLPSRVGKPGRIIGDIVASHFSYNTQERDLLDSNILSKYYKLAKLEMDPSFGAVPKESFKPWFIRWLVNRLLIGRERPNIALHHGMASTINRSAP